MSKTVLVTGATGFVGSHVLPMLRNNGRSVRAVVRNGKKNRLSVSTESAEIVETEDLWSETSAWWSDVCRDIDIVIHIAWYAEPGQYLQSFQNLDCLAGTLRLAQAVCQAKVRRFVGIGTCFEYDLTLGVLSVQTPLRPLTPYGGAKAAAFLALSQSLPRQGVEFAWCRLFYLYGKGEDERRFVPYLRAKLMRGEPAELTSGRQIRDYLDVRDAARMIVETALGDGQGPVNICSGIPITIRQFAEQIADEYGRRDLLHFGVRQEKLVDPPCVVGLRGEVLS